MLRKKNCVETPSLHKTSRLLTRSLPVEEVFQVNSQNRPVANLPVLDFRSQLRETTEYVTFSFLPPLGTIERHCQ